MNTRDEIHAVHLLTEEKIIVASGLQYSSAMAVDAIGMNVLYYEHNNRISMRDIEDEGVKVIMKSEGVIKMAIDWIGRRIFWTDSSSKKILVVNLDGQERRAITNTTKNRRDVAIDSISG
jgi:hypothetical protein